MSLSCTCGDMDYSWTYYPPKEFTTLKTKRGRRCWSCKQLIKVGDECVEFERGRPPKNDIEINIYGDDYADVPLASRYMCEGCGGLYFALDELGFCIDSESGFNMKNLVKEYNETYVR